MFHYRFMHSRYSTMGLWKELKRVVRLDLHSYWEVFYLDLILLLFAVLLTSLFGLSLIALGVSDQYCQFVEVHIVTPVEDNVIKTIAPVGLSENTYETLTLALLFLVEFVFVHLLFCELYRGRKQMHKLTINTDNDVYSGGNCCLLPLFIRRSTTNGEEKEEKSSLCHRIKSELGRLCRLELHSCWEVFYIDVLLLIISFILSFPVCFVLNYFNLQKGYAAIMNEYIEKPVETIITRAVAPEGLSDYTYRQITAIAILACTIILFHLWTCLLYLCSHKKAPKSVETVDDVECGRGCFSRSRVAPQEEKKRPLVKTYQSVFSISSSSLYLNGSTEKLIDKNYALP